MVGRKELRRVSRYEWEIARSFRADMRVPVVIFCSAESIGDILDDRALEQAVNATTLPGVVGSVVVMPDVHQGYGFPIGGVAATRVPDGVISPGAIGYDINCGVRLLASDVRLGDVEHRIGSLASELDAACPSGVGTSGRVPLDRRGLERVCEEGARWALHHGLALEEDVERSEEGGCLEGADAGAVSDRARERGSGQMGTLGAGNHFLEVDVVEEVHDPDSAAAMGLVEGCLAVQIHCGSRGFGHQVCTDYVRSFQQAVRRHGIVLPDRELVCAPLSSNEGQAYLAAMRCAANYAFANRQVLAHHARAAFSRALGGGGRRPALQQVYDVAHNMGKIETHEVDGQHVRVLVHRKGATRAFPPGSDAIPAAYRSTGQPVLVPGSMGTSSWVLAGTRASMQRSFGSSCHGAGRTMSRSQARRTVHGRELKEQLEAAGIVVRAGSLPGLAEEAPAAYKDVDAVVATVVAAGIARAVARLRPVAVIKG